MISIALRYQILIMAKIEVKLKVKVIYISC